MSNPSTATVTFHGAAREVTGSCHLLEVDGARILLDCGLVQGGRERHTRNRAPFPFDAAALDCVVLSHAHIDHSGRLPLLRKAGYRGPILATEPTVGLCEILLADSGRIHEEDAKWAIRRLTKRRQDASWVQPLYTEDDALATLEQLVPLDFEEAHELAGVGSVRLLKAGHILGAAIVEITLHRAGSTTRLVFSGDLGVDGARLLGRPMPVACPEHLIIESTYGNRRRDEPGDRTELLYQVVARTIGRGGKVVIPSFAVGRTQELLARLNDLVESGRLADVPVYVDSPMAVAATRAFEEHPDAYSKTAHRRFRSGDEPLRFAGLRLTSSVEESIAINESREPSVIISASGMCTAGRVKHHLKHNISDPRSTVLFVGYQAAGTLGRVIQSGTSPVRIFGEWYSVNASLETIEGFSAHADLDELLEWFDSLGGTPRRTFVVHGEEQASLRFAETLGRRFGATTEVPTNGQRCRLD